MYQNQPLVGLDMTVNLMVKYSLIDQSNYEEIWVKDISSRYTANFSDALYGPERLNLANEGAVRNNIGELITTMALLNL